jgi:hypothetical protein
VVIFDESRPDDVPPGIRRIVDHLAPARIHEQQISTENQQSAHDHTSYQGPIRDGLVLVNLISGVIGRSKHKLRCLTVKLQVLPACVSTLRSALKTPWRGQLSGGLI